nr:MAG TPA: hypothetical protein [Caudoviricetes sp.]
MDLEDKNDITETIINVIKQLHITNIVALITICLNQRFPIIIILVFLIYVLFEFFRGTFLELEDIFCCFHTTKHLQVQGKYPSFISEGCF